MPTLIATAILDTDHADYHLDHWLENHQTKLHEIKVSVYLGPFVGSSSRNHCKFQNEISFLNSEVYETMKKEAMEDLFINAREFGFELEETDDSE